MKKIINDFEIENEVNGFVMENTDKLSRVIFGDMGRGGVMVGGLGVDKAKEDPELVLARYDRIAGHITKDSVKVKRGSFWDFKLKQPRMIVEKVVVKKATKDTPEETKNVIKYTPEVMYIFNVGGDFVEVDDPKNLAEAVTVINQEKSKKQQKVKEKVAKSKFFAT